jgi:predicted nucleic acid-binding protein
MVAIDTNILVYAHNTGASNHEVAKSFLHHVMNTKNGNGELSVCIPSQVLIEFMNVITWTRLESPLSLTDAKFVVEDYLNSDAEIIYPKPTQLFTLLNLLDSVKSRKKVFDVALAATLKDNRIQGLYTVNTNDFEEFAFLEVKNPL